VVPEQKDAKKYDSFPVTRCGDAAGKVDANDSNLKNEKAKLQGFWFGYVVLDNKKPSFEEKNSVSFMAGGQHDPVQTIKNPTLQAEKPEPGYGKSRKKKP
jgi:hypothetical protein